MQYVPVVSELTYLHIYVYTKKRTQIPLETRMYHQIQKHGKRLKEALEHIMKCSRLATGVWSANRGINTYASSNQKETFLDALASLDYKLSVSE